MDKKKALNIMFQCATEYQENLVNNNFLFAHKNSGTISFFQTLFPEENFRHLTGVETLSLDATEFFRACCDRRLSPEQFSFAENGTAPLKLSVLPNLMKIYKIAKTTGEFNNSGIYLSTERLVGNITASIGFIRREHGFYTPNTALKGDIRNLIRQNQQILAIFVKKIREKRYSKFTYIAKNILLDSAELQNELNEYVDFKNILTVNFKK